MIVVEKILEATAEIDQTLVDRYYALKRANGYSYDTIERERLSLDANPATGRPRVRARRSCP